ncbi:FAD-binding protein [Actinomycetospora sp. TBRC 11914]|uniref:FAD-binding protein n=1 Tax=Actinomycetospora sp. TBRC 11914 TaxID=2729387 RepID=UPI001B7D7317|nr:FAD-binding protein [Actinomycetospora sp. TBRC 11914]
MTAVDVADDLGAASGVPVLTPGTPGYEDTLARIFFPAAARRRPRGVVAPRTVEEVAAVLAAATATGTRVTVRGGGLSSNCVADDAVVLDLSAHLGGARPDGGRVVVGGGARVSTMLDALAPAGRAVPVGIVGHAGFGLVTRGGVGYLTRSLGLTLDHLVEVELVLPSGEVVRLSDASTGEAAELWWAVRGAAPAVGVVTSAVLRTHEVGPVWVDRAVVGLDALATYVRVAPELGRDTSMGAVLGWSDLMPDEPVLFLYTACAGGSGIARARAATDAVVAAAASPPRYRAETTGRYLAGLPEFALPGAAGAEPDPIRLPRPGDGPRGSFFGKSVFTGPTLDAALADALADRIRAAPTRACRIDLQHTGGALADVADSATAFRGRRAEWNIPLNAIWTDPADDEACLAWARSTLAVLRPHTLGVYSVELRPGFPETDAEIGEAYGGHLPRLRALRRRHDPAGVLGVLDL